MSDKRVVKHVSDMEIDEISLVDRPANQHALVTIAKRRATKEDTVPNEDSFYNADGVELTEDDLALGMHVYDADGAEYVLEADDDDTEDVEERELETAGVSKAFESDGGSELSKSILDELAKAVTDSDRNAVIAKALAKSDELSKRLEAAEAIAKSERDQRLTKEYISKAAEYNVPIPPEDLGPVLMRMAESMSFEDCSVIHKALTASGEMLFSEAGFKGQADNDDPMTQVEQIVNQSLAKSDGGISKAEAFESFFTQNPDAYDAYVMGMRG